MKGLGPYGFGKEQLGEATVHAVCVGLKLGERRHSQGVYRPGHPNGWYTAGPWRRSDRSVDYDLAAKPVH